MAFYLSPLVAVKEIDLTNTVPAVATSIGVIILRNPYKGSELKKEIVSSENQLVEKFGEPSSNLENYRDWLSAQGYLKYGNKLYVTGLRAEDSTFAGKKFVNSTTFNNFAPSLTLSDLDSGDPDDFERDVVVDDAEMWMIAKARGVWGNNVRVAMSTKTTQTQMISGGNSTWSTYPILSGVDSPLGNDKEFLVVVEAMDQNSDNWDVKEIWNVSTVEMAIDDQGITKFVENVINQRSQYIRVAMKEDAKNEPWTISTQNYVQLAGGTAGIAGVLAGDIMKALDLYRNPEEIDINIIIDGDKPIDVKKHMIVIAEERKDCIAVLDPPYELVVNNKGNEASDLRDWRRGLGTFSVDNLNENTSYASFYGNWIEIYDKYTKKYRWIPLSGHVAGIYANTDLLTDPWFAPAGLNRAILTGVRRLAWNPQLGERDLLYMSGINPVVSFAGQGKVIWGQKTLLDKESAFNRVNVRRLFIVLEKAISTAAKYFLFEPNDTVTRNQLVGMIEPFLRDVKSRRGIYEFKVVCDESNNTPERIDRNELHCAIFIKPTRTAEFIVLTFVATKTGASFDEAAAAIGIN